MRRVSAALSVCDSFRIIDTESGKKIENVYDVPSGIGLSLTFDVANIAPAGYKSGDNFEFRSTTLADKTVKPEGTSVTYAIQSGKTKPGKTYSFTIFYDPGIFEEAREICTQSFTTSLTDSRFCTITVKPPAPSVQASITATVTNLDKPEDYKLFINPPSKTAWARSIQDLGAKTSDIPVENFGLGNSKLYVAKSVGGAQLCEKTFMVTENGGSQLESQFIDLCSFATGEAREDCDTCTSEKQGIWTAIGCIPSTPEGFVQRILPFAMGLGGGIAFLLMLFGALQIMTSAGNPEKLNAGKELVTSAIVGLLLIIFSIFLLRLIGVSILKIPGFS